MVKLFVIFVIYMFAWIVSGFTMEYLIVKKLDSEKRYEMIFFDRTLKSIEVEAINSKDK